MEDLTLFGEKEEKWYTIEEIAELCGYASAHAMQSNSSILELLNQFSNSNDIKLGGYHNSRKFYSEKVVEAVKKYQLVKSAPNALKDKVTAVQGNVSYIEQATVTQTIDTLLDNPDTLELLLSKSLERNKVLGIENKQLKEIIEIQKPKAEIYDDFVAREKFCNFRDGANYLKIPQSEFMNLLKTKYIYKNKAGEYRSYSEYAKLITLRPFPKGTDKTGQQLMLTIDGLEFFRQKIKKDV